MVADYKAQENGNQTQTGVERLLRDVAFLLDERVAQLLPFPQQRKPPRGEDSTTIPALDLDWLLRLADLAGLPSEYLEEMLDIAGLTDSSTFKEQFKFMLDRLQAGTPAGLLAICCSRLLERGVVIEELASALQIDPLKIGFLIAAAQSRNLLFAALANGMITPHCPLDRFSSLPERIQDYLLSIWVETGGRSPTRTAIHNIYLQAQQLAIDISAVSVKALNAEMCDRLISYINAVLHIQRPAKPKFNIPTSSETKVLPPEER